MLRVARSSALKARTQAADQIRDLVVTAAEPLRGELRGLSTTKRVPRCARFRVTQNADPHEATRRALKHLARRWLALSNAIHELDTELDTLTRQAAPRLLTHFGVGTDVAGKLLVAAGDNPERLAHEGAFVRLRSDPTTRAYTDRRTKEGLSRRAIIRCLKRYLARQLYPDLVADLANARTLT